MHKAWKCDWTSCNTLKMQQLCLIRTEDENVCEQKQHLAFKKIKYSIRIARHFNV